MIFQNATAQKFISILLILAILSPAGFVMFSKPKPAEALFGIADLNIQALDIQEIVWKILQQVLIYIAKKLMDKITQATVNWINSGFQGKPAYLTDPGRFFGDLEKDELKGLVKDIGYDKVKFPFGKDFALGQIQAVKDSVLKPLEYSLSQTQLSPIDNLLLSTQFPQNNFIGFGILADEELNKRLTGPASPITKLKDELVKGVGFLDQKACKSNLNWNADKLKEGYQKPKYTPPDPSGYSDPDAFEEALNAYNEQYNQLVEKGAADFTKQYGCKEGPQTVSPGSIVSNNIMKSLNAKVEGGTMGAEMGNLLAAFLGTLIDTLLAKGLSELDKLTFPPPPKPLDEFNNNDRRANINLPGGPNYDPNTPLVYTDPAMVVAVNIINDDGGILNESGVQVFVDGNPTVINTNKTYPLGVHIISANDEVGYTKTIDGDCASDGSITLVSQSGLNETKTCTVLFDDIAGGGGTGDNPKMTLTAIVINNNGGTLDANDVLLYVDGNPRINGGQYTYSIGSHVVSESVPPGYTMTIGGDCASDGSITLALDDIKDCTIMNDDN